MHLKYKILCIFVVIFFTFFVGRYSSPEKLIKETKIEKFRDEEAIKIAVEEAIKKTRLEFKQKIVIDKKKEKDGSEILHKEIFSESTKLSEALNLGLEKINVSTKDYEKIELKPPLKRFGLGFNGGVEYLVDDMNVFKTKNLDAYLSGKFLFRTNENFTFSSGGKKYLTKEIFFAFIEAEFTTYFW